MDQISMRGEAHEAVPLMGPASAQATQATSPSGSPSPAVTSAATAVLPAPVPQCGYAESAGSMAGVAVLLGVVGLFVFNVVFGPLAIGIGTAALRRRSAAPRARAAALAGVALGAADLIVLAVLFALSLAHGGITWHFGS